MTSALATLLICIAAAALVIAIGTYFWVNRTPSTDERFDRYGRVPLFGVSLMPNAVEGEPDRSNAQSIRVESIPNDAEAPPAGGTTQLEPDESLSGPVSGGSGRTSSGVTPTSSTASPAVATSPSRTPPETSSSVPATPLKPRSASWGDRPGWPAELPFPGTQSRSVEHPAMPAVPAQFSRPNAPPTLMPRAGGSGTVGHIGLPNQSAAHALSADGVPGSMIEGHGIRFSIPAEGTLQFLPGRLEVSAGLDAGREIRFVRVPGPHGTEVTFGRNEGPLYRHIQLRDQTVSREHARMTLAEGRWSLANLSRTNPVALNGRILGLGEQQELQDGDRVEMGEVVFSFRSR